MNLVRLPYIVLKWTVISLSLSQFFSVMIVNCLQLHERYLISVLEIPTLFFQNFNSIFNLHSQSTKFALQTSFPNKIETAKETMRPKWKTLLYQVVHFISQRLRNAIITRNYFPNRYHIIEQPSRSKQYQQKKTK